MALVQTVVTPTQATAASGVATSSAFTPSAGSLVYVLFSYMFSTNTTGVTFTVGDNHSNSYSLTFTPLNNGGSGATYVGMASFTYTSAPGSTTVHVTASSTGAADCLITPVWFTGQAASQSGAAFASNTNGSSGTTEQILITPTTTGSAIVIAGAVAAVNVNSTAISGTTLAASWNDATVGNSANSGTTTSLSTGGVQVNVGFTLSGTSTFGYSIAALEVLPATGGPADVPAINPGPVWMARAKPGLPKPHPYFPDPTALHAGPVNVTLPPPVTNLSGTLVRPQDVPAISPGPTWYRLAKPGLAKPHPQVAGFELSGENGPLNITLPGPVVTGLTGTVVRPQDVPQILPGAAWFRQFKPGLARARPFKVTSGMTLHAGSLTVPLPSPVTSLSSVHVHSPQNLGAVLTEVTPDGAMTVLTKDATCTLANYGATLVLDNWGAHLVGWTMQTAPLNLSEFNDVSINIAVTRNGSPYDLTTATLNLLLKTQAGTADANALIFSSSGGSPAIIITNAVGGLATALIAKTNLSAETYNFYRLDVVDSGLTNTTLYGQIVWTTL